MVPTHNRSRPLKRLLNGLANQSFPLSAFEVIIVADGCTDDTVEMLQNFRPPYALLWVQQPSRGAAVARNTGAAKASSELYIFLDDDIDPSPDLVQSHVLLHNRPNKVVVGYLPIPHPQTEALYYINLWNWWEQKYQSMRKDGYRFSYTDLLSGNFSVPRSMFEQVGRFDATLHCREDYELGVRLIKAGADFEVSMNAWGYHRDEVTTSNRLFQRKFHEGKADVKFARLHPDLILQLPLVELRNPSSRENKGLLLLLRNLPAVAEAAAKTLSFFLPVFEKFRIRNVWYYFRALLCNYWYFKGATEEVKTENDLRPLFTACDTQSADDDFIDIDLSYNLIEQQRRLDNLRPRQLRFVYGGRVLGYACAANGTENIRSGHLKNLLSSAGLTAALQVESLTNLTETRKAKKTKKKDQTLSLTATTVS